MTIIKRADLGRPLTWDELDDNFRQVDNLTASASAVVSSAAASATAAAGSATASATSATDAANSAANAAAAIVSAVKSTVTFTTGGTLNSNLDRISDGTYLYYWTGAYPVTVPAGSTVAGTGGMGVGFWAADNSLISPTTLSSYGATADALSLLLTYAVSSGKECIIDVPVTLTTSFSFDASYNVIRLKWTAPIYCDSQLMTLTNLGSGSVLESPCFKNITVPYIIRRFDDSLNLIAPGAAVLATLTQSNTVVGYQPTASDSDVWSSLSSAIQTQSICAGLIVTNSDGVIVNRPTGRFAAYTFSQCNETRVLNPNIYGGKHTYGTILFKNTGTTSWGHGNYVIGGTIIGGSVSGVVHMRNAWSGGVHGGCVVERCGESGFKTYQNNVDGRSARNYGLTYKNITASRCGYDGLDIFADYGTQVERIDDYTIAQYAWGQLPTMHIVSNVTATNCGATGTGTGITADGQFNVYSDIVIRKSASSGFFHSGAQNTFQNVYIKNGNTNSATAGAQMRILGVSSLNSITIETDPTVVTGGYALYSIGAGTTFKSINLDKTNLISQPLVPAQQNLVLGRISSTDSTNDILCNPQPTILTNYVSRIRTTVTYAVSGSERSTVNIQPVYAGAYVNGLLLRGENGGVAILGVGNASNSGFLSNGQVQFYESSGNIKLQYKSTTGTVTTYTLTPDP